MVVVSLSRSSRQNDAVLSNKEKLKRIVINGNMQFFDLQDDKNVADFGVVLEQLKQATPDVTKFDSEKDAYIAFSKSCINANKRSFNNQGKIAYLLQFMLVNGLYPNAIIFNNLFYILGEKNWIEAMVALYDVVAEKNLLDRYTFIYLIKFAGKNQQIDISERAYEDAKQKGFLTEELYNEMIVAAINNERFDLAERVYNESQVAQMGDKVKKPKSSEDTDNKKVDAILSVSTPPRSVQPAQIKKTISTEQLAVLKDALTALQKLELENTAKLQMTALHDTLEKGIWPDIQKINLLLGQLGNDKSFAKYIMAIYKAAVSEGIANRDTYYIAMKMAYQFDNFKLVQSIYQAACQSNIKDGVPRNLKDKSYALMIKIANDNDEFTLTSAVYCDAKRAGQAGRLTHQAMLAVAEKKHDVALAKSIYEAAIQANQVSSAARAIVMRVAGFNDDFSYAKEIYHSIPDE